MVPLFLHYSRICVTTYNTCTFNVLLQCYYYMHTSVAPKIFLTKYREQNSHEQKILNNNNYSHQSKSHVPLDKEWSDGIYAFNNNIVKSLANSHKNANKLIKGYFNFYSLTSDNKIIPKEFRIKDKRFSINKTFMGKLSLKHTASAVNITAYVYDRSEKYFENRSQYIDSIDNNTSKEVFFTLDNLRDGVIKLEALIKNRISVFTPKDLDKKGMHLLKQYINIYINYYIMRHMRKEIVFICNRQSINFHKSKFEKQHILPLITLLERTYNKKIIFNIVKIKCFYSSSSILSELLITKLNNKFTKIQDVLKYCLDVFELPPINKLTIYNKAFKKDYIVQNLDIINLASVKLINGDSIDPLDSSLFKYYDHDNNSKYLPDSLINISEIIRSIKHKYTNGIKINMVGRLSRKAETGRSTHMAVYKGSTKDMDSSYKGLSTALLRGYYKPNLLYTASKSKLRVGNFGLKT